MTQRKIQDWVMPPTVNRAFVARMTNVLEPSAVPYDPCFSGLCMDDHPMQVLKETCVPITAFPAEQARELVRHIAENELSVLTRQC
jgi:hypothetical protein